VGGKVGDLARESSGTTHPNAMGQEACVAWAMCVARLVCTAAVAERMQEGLGMMKLDVLHHFASYLYTMPALQEALAAMYSCLPRWRTIPQRWRHTTLPPAVPRRRDAACFHCRRHCWGRHHEPQRRR
jgi:hypothetical protein